MLEPAALSHKRLPVVQTGPLRRHVRKQPLSDAEQDALHLIFVGIRRFGGRLLTATSAEELEAQAEAIIEEPGFHMLLALLQEAPEEESASGLGAELVQVCGEELRPLLVDTDKLSTAYFRVLDEDAERRRLEPLHLLINAPIERPLAFVEDPRVPVPVAQLVVAGHLGIAYLLALARALIEQRPLPQRLAARAVAGWRHGVQSMLRLVASVPGVDVPETLIPPHERLDLVALRLQAEGAERLFQQLADRAKETGASVAPLGAANDE